MHKIRDKMCAFTRIGELSAIATATGIQLLVKTICCVSPDASREMVSPSGSMLSVNTIQPMRLCRSKMACSISARWGVGIFKAATVAATPARSSADARVTMLVDRSSGLEGTFASTFLTPLTA
jgi:hypothetical protein